MPVVNNPRAAPWTVRLPAPAQAVQPAALAAAPWCVVVALSITVILRAPRRPALLEN